MVDGIVQRWRTSAGPVITVPSRPRVDGARGIKLGGSDTERVVLTQPAALPSKQQLY